MIYNIQTIFLIIYSNLILLTQTFQTIYPGDHITVNATNNQQQLTYHYKFIIAKSGQINNSLIVLSGYTEYEVDISIYSKIRNKDQSQQQTDFPSPSNFQKQCSNNKLISCVFDLDLIDLNQTQSVYLTVILAKPALLKMQSNFANISTLNSEQIRYLTFSQQMSFIFEFSQIQYQKQILIMGEYYNQNVKNFQVDLLDLKMNTIQKSMPVSADSQAFKLNAKTNLTNYYVIVYGIIGCDISFAYAQITDQISFNTPYWYLYSSEHQNYNQMKLQFDQYQLNSSEDKIIIDIQIYSGKGALQINYCLGGNQSEYLWQYIYDNNDGKSGHLIIMPQEREVCIDDSGIQKISIRIIEPGQMLFFSLNPYITNFQQIQDIFEDRRSIVTVLEQCIQYQLLWIIPNQSISLTIAAQNSKGIQNIDTKVQKCDQQTQCTQIIEPNLNEEDQNVVIYQWLPKQSIYKLSICNSNQQSSQILSIALTTKTKQFYNIKYFSGFHDLLPMNAFNYYQIDIPEQSQQNTYKNVTAYLQLYAINGKINYVLVNNLKQLNKCQSLQQQAIYHHQIDISSETNEENKLYLYVKGLAQTLYYIQTYLDQEYPDPGPQPDPTPSDQIIEVRLNDGINRFGLQNGVNYVFQYSAHFYPYSINVIEPLDCLQIFFTKEQAMNLSQFGCIGNSPFHEQFKVAQLYLRAKITSNITQIYQLTIQIVLPQIVLKKFNQIALSCQKYCQTDIIIQIQQQYGLEMSIVHYGMGTLITDNSTNDTTFSCQSPVTCNKTIKAILPFGGTMFIEDQQINSKYVTWSQQKVMISQNPINMIIPLNQYSSIDVFLLKFPGANIEAIFTLFQFNYSETSYQTYAYLPPQQALFFKDNHPFQYTMSINLSQISPEHCSKIICYVTMSIYINNALSPVDYQSQNKPYVSYSLNSYLVNLPINVPYNLRQIYGIRYFKIISEGQKIVQNQLTLIHLSLCSSIKTIFYEENQQLGIQLTDACQYVVVASSCPMISIIQGVPQTIQVQNRKQQYMMYYNQKNGPFTIQIQGLSSQLPHKIQIGIKKVQLNSSDQCQPLHFNSSQNQFITLSLSKNHNFYMSQNNTLLKMPQNTTAGYYKVTLYTKQQIKKFLKIRILYRNIGQNNMMSSTVIIGNQEPFIVQIIPQSNSTSKFKYFSQSKFKICLTLSGMQHIGNESYLDVKINESTIINKNISEFRSSNISENCLTIQKHNGQNYIFQYQIQAYLKSESNTTQYLFIKIVEQLKPLPLYDSVAANIQSIYEQCFIYDSDIQISELSILLVSTSLSDHSSPSISNSPFQNSQLLQFSVNPISKQGKSYKLTLTAKLSPLSHFYWCISDFSDNYDILINNNKHLETILATSQSYYHLNSTKKIDKYDIYQILIPQQTLLANSLQSHGQIISLMIEIVPCGPTPKHHSISIMGTTNFQDIQSGRISEIQDQIKNLPHIYIARGIAVTSAYYYLGIKHQFTNQVNYEIKTYIEYTNRNPYLDWQLANVNITSVHYYSKQQSYLSIVLPKLQYKYKDGLNVTQNTHNFTYQLIISPRNDSSISNLWRCSQENQKLKNNAQYFILQNPHIPMFKIKSDNLPQNMTISGKVTVSMQTSQQPLRYFYEQKNYNIPDNSDTQPQNTQSNKMIWLVVFVIAVIFIIIVGRFFYRFYKRRRNTIQFQMAQSNRNNVEMLEGNSSSNSRPRQQNQNVGYGQFVDEIS